MISVQYHIGKSNASSVTSCINEVTREFRSPKLIMYFSRPKHFEEYTTALYEKYPNSICIGSTTITMLSKTTAQLSDDGLLAVSFESGIKCSAGVLEDVDKYPIKSVGNVKKCLQELGTTRNTLCFEITTALLCAEESALSTLNSVLLEKDIPIFGGSAGDGTTAVETKVALNGCIREKSTVFVLIHNESGMVHFFRENIYKPITGNHLLATKVNMSKRQVMTFNNQSAYSVYAKELGVPESQASNYFDTNPLGRIVGDDLFITANCAKGDNNSMFYHARIYENSQIVVLEPDDYRAVNKATMEKIKKECPHPSFAIVCNCLARTMLFDSEGYLQEFAQLLGNTLGDYVGFSGYGEQLGQYHFNQTLSICVFD